MHVADTLISRIDTYIVNPLLLVVFAAGFFMFMYGLLQFMLSANSGEDTSTGKQHMIYGTAGMLIMVSVYGIISLLDHTFNLNVANPNTDPTNINVSSRSIFGN